MMHLIYKNSFFSYYLGSNGQDRCTIDLTTLFPSQQGRDFFESRWELFLNSDPVNAHILSRSANILEYLTESVIPPLQSSKPCMLLLFGNPAPHSVKDGVMFSSEGNGREHRIWRFLDQTGILSFGNKHADEKPNGPCRMKRLLNTDYESPFQLAFASFISLPSTASDPLWAGVAGIKKLLGSKAFAVLCNAEFQRLRILLRRFMPNEGIVVAFQKDAFSSLRSEDTPPYSLQSCFSGTLTGSLKQSPNIFLGAVPPTRLMLSSKAKAAFIKVTKEGVRSIGHAQVQGTL